MPKVINHLEPEKEGKGNICVLLLLLADVVYLFCASKL
jgi:hypothetical protein